MEERLSADGTVLTPCAVSNVRWQLDKLLEHGIESIAICLLHANVNPVHEQQLAALARQRPFANVSVSHEVSSLRKALPRGDTTILDAYLTPVLQHYVQGLNDHLHPDSRLELMTSSGGLTSAATFRGKDSILSGPAGGVVGVAAAARTTGYKSAIGFDMGGTSTDVSRWAGDFELEFETEKAGVRVVTPMMAIETVAAGGGSLCCFDGVKLSVGPESAGASPGPACYGSGGPLAVTDINLLLGKILPDAFPFALDRGAVERQLAELCADIATATGQPYTVLELADGFLRVANSSMVEAIRCVTVDRGIDPREDVLVAFGGAAGQHACAVAGELGIREVLIHPSAGILSALGIGRAEVSVHREEGIYSALDEISENRWNDIFQRLRQAAVEELRSTHDATRIQIKESLDLRFYGLDEAITVARPPDGRCREAYEEQFRTRCGYLPTRRDIEVVTARVLATAEQTAAVPRSSAVHNTRPEPSQITTMVWDAKPCPAQVFERSRLKPGDSIVGPAMVTEDISTTIVDPGWRAEVWTGGELVLRTEAKPSPQPHPAAPLAHADPVLLEVVYNKPIRSHRHPNGSDAPEGGTQRERQGTARL